MKAIRFFAFAAFAATMLGSCSNEDSISHDFLADTPIKLNVSVDEPTTRAGYSNTDTPTSFGLGVMHNNINNEDKYNYGVLAELEDNNWKTYDIIPFFIDGTKKEVTMLWANMNDKVTVYAISDITYSRDGSIHNHPTDQTTPDALKKADFLAMPYTQVVPTQDGINVEFKHTMSKIKLTIELGDEYEFTANVDKNITDLKIDGSLVKAYCDIRSSTDNPQFSFKSHYGDPTPISPFLTATTPYSKTEGTIKRATASYEAILIPQTIESGKFTVSFRVDGKLYEWAYNKELTLTPTTAYTLKLTAGNDKVQPVSFSVFPWVAGNGEGEEKETD